MDRYQRVEKPRMESTISENEIRITTQGLIRNYTSYATTLLQEKRVKEILMKAMGQAIRKTVTIAEIIKKRIPGLHQDTVISSTRITDVWEPIEEGLVPLENTRLVSMISTTLSKKELNKNSPGSVAVDSYGHGGDRYDRGRGLGRGRGWGRSYSNNQENGGWNWGLRGGRRRGRGGYEMGGNGYERGGGGYQMGRAGRGFTRGRGRSY